ncbi:MULTISPECIES: hypothetical protein [Saccharopolyspora]|nr:MULTISPECIES: hypothetical protein [Saccharopolyspora]
MSAGELAREAAPMPDLLWAVGLIVVFVAVALTLRGLTRWR